MGFRSQMTMGKHSGGRKVNVHELSDDQINKRRDSNLTYKQVQKEAKKKAAAQKFQRRQKELKAGGAERDWRGNYKEDKSIKSESSSGMSTEQGIAAGSAVTQAVGIGSESTDVTGNAVTGTLSGAQTGLMLSGGNLVGAAVGAVVGGTLGAIKARQARKAAQYEAEAKKQEAMAKIEGDKGERIQRAMAGLGQAFSRNLNKRLQVRL